MSNSRAYLTALTLAAALLAGATLAVAQQADQKPADPKAAAPAADGQTKFNNSCRTCHTMKEGDNRLGPNLAGIIGRKSGAAQGYSYSSALAGGKITWDEATLDKFIANPEAVAPGNNMKPYTGMTDAGERKAIIDFLKTAKAD